MAHSPSPDALGADDVEVLLDLADAAIVAGLVGRRPPVPTSSSLPTALRAEHGLFVTLTIDDELNGCIGAIEGAAPIGVAVVRHAWSAAFEDPRLPTLRGHQYERLGIEVSVLSPLEPITVGSRDDLLAGLDAGVDGLVIGRGARRAVFLPAVWEHVPEPADFLAHLEAKAGIPPGGWDSHMTAHRFTAAKFRREPGARRPPSGQACRAANPS
jgi:AmmeMemoRadiSam system protein A